MSDVIAFPITATPSQVDPPTVDYRSAVIALEHEIADLQVIIAEQAVKLRRRAPALLAQSWRLSSAALVAFVIGWMMEPPAIDAAPHSHAIAIQAPAANHSKLSFNI